MRSSITVFVFGIYLMLAGLGFVFLPNIILPLFGFAETAEIWIRVLGLLVFVLGYYFIHAARSHVRPFFEATIPARVTFASGLFLFVIILNAPPMLAAFAVIDLLGAAWTWWALKKERIP
ncbi:hypothetical protein L0Y46_00975 [bacterium]|nr:hypothetical protein [bacterium]